MTRWGAREGVAGVMAAGALFIGFFELAYRPFRLAPVALAVALVAAGMSRQQQRLVLAAVLVVGACFVAGAAIAILTGHPLY